MDLQRIFLDPWLNHADLYIWILVMGSLVALCCAWLGCFLVLRRMALVGDAVSHAVLPGIVLAFLWSGSLGAQLAMWTGAVIAGLISGWLVETIRGHSRIKEDASLGIVLTSLFALGVVMISLWADKVDLDQDCVLYGEIAFIPLQATWAGIPIPVVSMGGVTLTLLVVLVLFYRPLLLSSFDPLLAGSLGLRPKLAHYGLMAALSIVIVTAFEAVGAILVVAMLILPAASAYLCTARLPAVLGLASLHGLLSTLLGLHLAIALDCSIAAAMVLCGCGLFGLSWLLGPVHGILLRLWRRRQARQHWERESVLEALESEGSMSVSELARAAGWEMAPLLQLVKELQREGRVQLEGSQVSAVAPEAP